MARSDRPRKSKDEWRHHADNAAANGDYVSAKAMYERAIKANKRDVVSCYHLAIVLQRLGQDGAAMAMFTQALKIRPAFSEAAERLSHLIAERGPLEPENYQRIGLKAALNTETAEQQALSEAVIAYLTAKGRLADALHQAGRTDWDQVALSLLERRTADVLRDDLFIDALSLGVNKSVTLENLLMALRRTILLVLDEERFADKALLTFAVALIRQCQNNEYVFAAGDDERNALAKLTSTLADSDLSVSKGGRDLLRAALYVPVEFLLNGAPANQWSEIRPGLLRDVCTERLTAVMDEREIAKKLPRIGEIADETSLRVSGQYEHSPYPRWTSMKVPESLSRIKSLGKFVDADKLKFADSPFDVLVAGAGTGLHAIHCALAYGPKARILAIDLSAASLSYGARMAEKYDVTNITFAQADILNLPNHQQRFAIIESAGVLHHMADPFQGWRILNDRLLPGGLMYIGLYSEVARAALTALRDCDDYPGPGCSDDAARVYRRALIARDPEIPGGRLVRSKDFHCLSEFRDLLLHEQETCMTLEEIATFLTGNNLEFRGFSLSSGALHRFAEKFPNDKGLGTLANWSLFEQEHPGLFNGMYRFWCAKSD